MLFFIYAFDFLQSLFFCPYPACTESAPQIGRLRCTNSSRRINDRRAASQAAGLLYTALRFAASPLACARGALRAKNTKERSGLAVTLERQVVVVYGRHFGNRAARRLVAGTRGGFRRKELDLVGDDVEARALYAVAILVIPTLHSARDADLVSLAQILRAELADVAPGDDVEVVGDAFARSVDAARR